MKVKVEKKPMLSPLSYITVEGKPYVTYNKEHIGANQRQIQELIDSLLSGITEVLDGTDLFVSSPLQLLFTSYARAYSLGEQKSNSKNAYSTRAATSRTPREISALGASDL